MPDDQQVRYLGDVQRLALCPGDIVVLKTSCSITPAIAERLREYAEQTLADHKVLVLSDGLEIGVLGRSGESADH